MANAVTIVYLCGCFFACGLAVPTVRGSPKKAYWLKATIVLLLSAGSWIAAGWLIATYLQDLLQLASVPHGEPDKAELDRLEKWRQKQEKKQRARGRKT